MSAGEGRRDTHATFTAPVPLVAPMGVPLTADGVLEAWDSIVAPWQADAGAPQSVEQRIVMAVMRSVFAGLLVAEADGLVR